MRYNALNFSNKGEIIMEAWMAFVSIMAIVAIVLIAGGLIAFIGHMIIGAIDTDNKTNNQSTEKEVRHFEE